LFRHPSSRRRPYDDEEVVAWCTGIDERTAGSFPTGVEQGRVERDDKPSTTGRDIMVTVPIVAKSAIGGEPRPLRQELGQIEGSKL
jgi:hypothetical protein